MVENGYYIPDNPSHQNQHNNVDKKAILSNANAPVHRQSVFHKQNTKTRVRKRNQLQQQRGMSGSGVGHHRSSGKVGLLNGSASQGSGEVSEISILHEGNEEEQDEDNNDANHSMGGFDDNEAVVLTPSSGMHQQNSDAVANSQLRTTTTTNGHRESTSNGDSHFEDRTPRSLLNNTPKNSNQQPPLKTPIRNSTTGEVKLDTPSHLRPAPISISDSITTNETDSRQRVLSGKNHLRSNTLFSELSRVKAEVESLREVNQTLERDKKVEISRLNLQVNIMYYLAM